MKQKISRWNHLSIFFFGLSSGSLFGIPFLNLEHGFSGVAYFLAAIFWIGLLLGIGLQLLGANALKKHAGTKKPTGKEKWMGIPVLFFLFLLIMILCFWKNSIALISMDLALLLFSIETYFYLKRRGRV